MGWIGLIGPNAPSVKTLDGRGRNGPYPLMAFGLPYIALAATEFIAPRPPDCGAGVWRAPPGTALRAARTPEVRLIGASPAPRILCSADKGKRKGYRPTEPCAAGCALQSPHTAV